MWPHHKEQDFLLPKTMLVRATTPTMDHFPQVQRYPHFSEYMYTMWPHHKEQDFLLPKTMLVRATTPTMDHFPRHVTRVRKFGYYYVNPAWEGNIFK